MTTMISLITVLVALAALAPKLADAHGYMMVRTMRSCVNELVTAPCMCRPCILNCCTLVFKVTVSSSAIRIMWRLHMLH